MILEIIFIIIGFVLLVKGADFLLKSATSIAKKFGLSETIIGLTVVAIGTSLPEIFITITSSINGHSDLIIGNAIGRISALVKRVKFDKRIVKTHIPICIIAMCLVLLLGNITKLEESYIINRWQGVILLFCAIGYIVYTIYEEKTIKNKTIEKEIIEEVELKEINSGVIIVIYLILGILGLKFGSNFVVDNSILIAEKFGLSENIIGMTIIAVGTALPEIITGIIAAKRNETDLLLGNITGSNILNLLLLIGLGAVISPIKLMSNFNMTMLVLIAVTILLKFVSNINKNNELDKKEGVLLITIYVIYILFAILV